MDLESNTKLESNLSDDIDDPILGFYSVTELESIGFCGGLLVLAETGRPVEFHCTLPLLPGRAQQILYGDALRSCLTCEHIGPPLIAKARTEISVVLINDPDGMRLSNHIELPVALIGGHHDSNESDDKGFHVISCCGIDQSAVQSLLDRKFRSLDPGEPFDRIRLAIEEAHAVAR